MAMTQAEENDLEDNPLEEKVHPHAVQECRQVEHSDAQVEGQRLTGRHHGAAAANKLFPDVSRDVIAEALCQAVQHLLAAGCHVFLAQRIADVEEEVEFFKPVGALPSQTVVAELQFVAAVEFAALGTQLEVEMLVAIVVGKVGLTDMAPVAGVGSEQPSPDSPRGCEAQSQGYVDELEPDVAGKAVENASDKGLLTGHASQLSVGTVQPVGHDEEADGDEVALEVGAHEEKGGSGTEDDADERHSDGMDVQNAEKLSPKIAGGACE